MINNSIEKLQNEELAIAKYFIALCENNGLEYFMLGGTLLGAVRHKGFIPWDDDMDFGMPREDYEKFIEILNKESNEYIIGYYKLGTSRDYPLKLESDTVQVKDMSTSKLKIRNAWIDIFPLDGMPNGRLAKNIHKFRLLSLRALFKISQLSDMVSESNPYRSTKEKLIISIAKFMRLEYFLNERKILDKLDKRLKKYSYEKSNYVVNFMGAYKFKEMFPKDYYKQLVDYSFDAIKFKGPKKYDDILSQMYGNYMILPDEKDRNKHSTEVI